MACGEGIRASLQRRVYQREDGHKSVVRMLNLSGDTVFYVKEHALYHTVLRVVPIIRLGRGSS